MEIQSNTLYSNTTDASKLPAGPDLFSYYSILLQLLIRTFLSGIHWLCRTFFIAPKSEIMLIYPFLVKPRVFMSFPFTSVNQISCVMQSYDFLVIDVNSMFLLQFLTVHSVSNKNTQRFVCELMSRSIDNGTAYHSFTP